jgi:hypothetical protein
MGIARLRLYAVPMQRIKVENWLIEYPFYFEGKLIIEF